MILALDIGTRCGWAAAMEDAPPLPAYAPLLGGEAGGRAALRHYHHGLFKPTAGIDRGRHYLRYADWLTGHCRCLSVTLIRPEFNAHGAASMKSEDAALRTFGLMAVTEAVGATLGVPVRTVNTSSMQLHAVGTGRDKGKVLREKRATALGIGSLDPNVIDAVFTLSFALHEAAMARAAARDAA